jgi:FAD/FMN-containing dehydrogenase
MSKAALRHGNSTNYSSILPLVRACWGDDDQDIVSGEAVMDASNPSFDVLRSDFDGTVIDADHADFDDARRVWNAMIDRKPTVIARCRGTADVMRAVDCTRGLGLPVAIRGGGHNVAGHAVCDEGVMIDLSDMRAVHVDPARRIAVVEGGATWAEFDREAQVSAWRRPAG